MTYNILRGFEIEQQLDAILKHPDIPPPDILLLSELDRGCPRTQYRNIAREYAKALGMYYVFGVEFVELGQAGCEHGNAILSRYPLSEPRLLRFAHNADTFIVGEGSKADEEPRLGGRMAIAADAIIGERRLHLYSTHLESSYYDYDFRIAQAREIASDAQAKPYNVVIGGDFNSITYAWHILRDQQQYAITDAFTERGFVDTHWGLPSASRGTYPAYPRLVLDLLFAREGTASAAGRCASTRCKSLSDHLPIWATVEVSEAVVPRRKHHLEQHPNLPPGTLAIGHRGAGDLCADNTRACYQKALDLGANALEADLQVLGDGSLVMFHDEHALRQTGQDLALADMDLADFKALDMGWAFTSDGGVTYPLRGLGLTGMSFKEFLLAFPDTPVLLDVKPESGAMAGGLPRFVQEHFSPDDYQRVYIKSNSLTLPRQLRRLSPAPKVAFSRYERMLLLIFPALLNDLPPGWIDLEPKYIDSKLIQWAHRQGHIISSSTIDEPETMQSLLSQYALDGLVTNRPDLLGAWLTQPARPDEERDTISPVYTR